MPLKTVRLADGQLSPHLLQPLDVSLDSIHNALPVRFSLLGLARGHLKPLKHQIYISGLQVEGWRLNWSPAFVVHQGASCPRLSGIHCRYVVLDPLTYLCFSRSNTAQPSACLLRSSHLSQLVIHLCTLGAGTSLSFRIIWASIETYHLY